VGVHQKDGLNLRVVVGIVAREELDPATIRHAKPARRVGYPLAGDERDQAREDADTRTSCDRGLKALAAGGKEARSRDHVQLWVLPQVIEQLVDMARVMLPVAVDLHSHVVATLQRVDVATLHRATDPKVERHSQHGCTGLCRSVGRPIGRAIVDDQHIELGRILADRSYRRGDRVGLVECGNDGEIASHVKFDVRQKATSVPTLRQAVSCASGPAVGVSVGGSTVGVGKGCVGCNLAAVSGPSAPRSIQAVGRVLSSPLTMNGQQWRADQRNVRETSRSLRQGPGEDLADSAAESHPLVSVIVVCWNAGKVLGRCLDQLYAQDYPNYEVIVVDDGSDDDTLSVADAARGLGEMTVVRSRHNRGCPHARNLGILHARGEIIAFIDADGFATTSWLRHLVAAFAADDTVGSVASTVFFEANPLVINGAGGIVNRQGWAADLSMNQSYEQAEIASEALYPMGCGMAFRRSALERVGPFDDRMLNYYDDVDYGVRLWRAGYRVVVARDAWIDHDFGQSGADSPEKELLCERHRMRVVLKHESPGSVLKWLVHEARELRRVPSPRRAVKLKAIVWNVRHLPGTLVSRRRLRRAPRAPDRLIDPSWGDGFPAGLPPVLTPRPELAGSTIDMADPTSKGQLIHGWFPPEHVNGRSYRWAGVHAAALMRLDAPAKRLRLDYAHVPVDIGGVDLRIRHLGSPDPLEPVWSTQLAWQYIARSVENHPLELAAGDYEVVFRAREGWSEPPHGSRSLALALATMSLEPSFDIPSGGGLDMASPDVEDQLVSGWLEPEHSVDRSYRWAGARAAAVVHVADTARSARLVYRLPPIPSDLTVAIRALDQPMPVWTVRIAWRDAEWHADSFPVQLASGDYLVSFDAEAPWSNPDQADQTLWAENRSLGVALSSLSFGELT
jgi:GT2 family glycosyltransferase